MRPLKCLERCICVGETFFFLWRNQRFLDNLAWARYWPVPFHRQGRLYFSENDTPKHSQSGDLRSLTIARNIIISYHGNIIQPFPPTDTHACTLDLSLEALQITHCRCVVLKVFKCLRMKWAGTSCMHQLKEGWEKQGVDFPGQMIVFYPSMCCQTTSAGGWGGCV